VRVVEREHVGFVLRRDWLRGGGVSQRALDFKSSYRAM
jgi:hypothetical protein